MFEEQSKPLHKCILVTGRLSNSVASNDHYYSTVNSTNFLFFLTSNFSKISTFVTKWNKTFKTDYISRSQIYEWEFVSMIIFICKTQSMFRSQIWQVANKLNAIHTKYKLLFLLLKINQILKIQCQQVVNLIQVGNWNCTKIYPFSRNILFLLMLTP